MIPSQENHQVSRFFSRGREKCSKGINTLLLSWPWGSPLCVPCCSSDLEGLGEVKAGGSGAGSGGASLAPIASTTGAPSFQPCRSCQSSPTCPFLSAKTSSVKVLDSHPSPSSRAVPPNCLASEWEGLSQLGYSEAVLNTLLSDWRPSTNQVYSYTWRVFSNWCAFHKVASSRPSVTDLLEFLQAGLEKGLSTATLKSNCFHLGVKPCPLTLMFENLSRALLNAPTIHRAIQATL